LVAARRGDHIGSRLSEVEYKLKNLLFKVLS